jgi:hypothetical protein
MTIEVRAVIHSFCPLDKPDEDILALLESAGGEGIVSLKAMKCWISNLRNGKTDLDNEPRPGPPRRNEHCRS